MIGRHILPYHHYNNRKWHSIFNVNRSDLHLRLMRKRWTKDKGIMPGIQTSDRNQTSPSAWRERNRSGYGRVWCRK